jgi:outer membrane protein OmpA-like peptidoglycan-associated protein
LGATAGGVTGLLSSGIGVIPGVAAGAVLGGSYGAYVDKNANLQDQLENRGATVVVLGDQIYIALPSERIFNDMTGDIRPQAYSTLALVSQYISSYTNMTVKVAAFTDDSGNKRVDLALSQQQAESVSKALQANGINTRLMYATGYGGTNLVEKNAPDWEGNDNYRIEITLEKQYV